MNAKEIEIEKSLLEIGRSMLRIMMYQATARITGQFDMNKDNRAYANMVMATRSAGKLLRTLAESSAKDKEAREQLCILLEAIEPSEALPIIRMMNDGHLALIIQSPTEI